MTARRSPLLERLANDPATIAEMAASERIRALRRELLSAMRAYRYTYNFTWLGQPIIQVPDDIVAVAELIHHVRPDLIVETGVAHGGSLLLSAGQLAALGVDGLVVGIDIEIRPANRAAIEASPVASRIRLIERSSTDAATLVEVGALAAERRRAMVLLDSNHSHAHVLAELRAYAPLVREGSYIVVFDTAIEDVTDGDFGGRPWGKGDNPKTAVWQFVRENPRFVIDRDFESKLLITGNPDGYLRCVRDAP